MRDIVEKLYNAVDCRENRNLHFAAVVERENSVKSHTALSLGRMIYRLLSIYVSKIFLKN